MRLVRFSAVLLLVSASLASPATVMAQQDRSVPRADYFQSFAPYYEGEYETSAKAFRSAARSGVRSTAGRWVDSICYYTMMGESLYQMGELSLALDQYNAALQLYVAHQNWMLRLKLPPSLRVSNSARTRTITWGPSQRNSPPAQVPDTILSFQGTDIQRAVQEGGVAASQQYYPVRASEVARCIALAMRRRAALLGPVGPHAALTKDIVDAASRRPAPPNTWSQAWVDCHLGLAYLMEGKTAQAASELQKSLQVQGQMDHPLTGIALLELGKIAIRQGNNQAAANYFLEASLSAAVFDQYDVVREALEGGYLTWRLESKPGMYPPLVPALAWARRGGSALEASISLLIAENAAGLGDTRQATRALAQAKREMSRRDMQRGAIGARYQYLVALTSFQAGDMRNGNVAFGAAMSYMAKGSHWLFHMGLADRLYTAEIVSDRVAMGLYDVLLRDPNKTDWLMTPMESLTVLMAPHPAPIQHWFQAAINRKENQKALEISDRYKRHRFHSTLPMGGRLLSLRWILEAPDQKLSKEARLQRQDLRVKFAAYDELSQKAALLKQQAAAVPLFGEDFAANKKQAQLLTDLARNGNTRELLMRQIALGSEPSDLVFPPNLVVNDVQQKLKPGEMVVAFHVDGRDIHAFVFTSQNYAHWKAGDASVLQRGIAKLLREIGHSDRSQPVKASVLKDEQWKITAGQLQKMLFAQIQPQTWKHYDELTIVPDGALWYLPFEILQVDSEEGPTDLMSNVRIRYAPTVSLTGTPSPKQNDQVQTIVTSGPMVSRESDLIMEGGLKKLSDVTPLTFLPDRLTIPSGAYAPLARRLLVLRDIDETIQRPYDWSPFQVDRGKAGSDLESWIALPWGAPQDVYLPGFHSSAENGLKQSKAGRELFLAVCGLMASGTDTILISRWRVGGMSTRDLLAEYLQELPHTSPAASWQRSVQVLSQNTATLDFEPRVFGAENGEELPLSHPFFWSGYMVVD